ncbi:MAG: glycine cleavage system protein H [Deltaproteobacteria bacterium]|nr:glycine cleavage system protein H [Deltaproteobacteria bacterium]
MVLILVFLTFVFAITVGSYVRRYVLKREVSMAEAGRANVLHLVKDDVRSRGEVAVPWLRKEELALSPVAIQNYRIPIQFPKEVYYHKGHTWVRPEGEKRVKTVKVGMDDFTQELMGDIEAINLPAIGEEVKQGEVAWEIHHGKRKLNQLAPLSGTVVDVNEKVIQDPSWANRSPYQEGWILKIRPSNLGEEMPGLMDSFQFQVFFDQVKAKLRAAISHPTLGMVYGDGGEMVRGIAGKLDEKLWRIVVSQLFHAPK